MKLRDYQEDLIDRTRVQIKGGRRRILVQSPTGSGKGVVLAEILRVAHGRRWPTLFLVHKRELVNQTSWHLWEHEVDHGVIMAGKRPRKLLDTQIGTIQTLVARMRGRDYEPPEARLVVVDEAHHVGAKTYNQVLEHYPQAIILGYTATPLRKSGRSLGDFFESLVVGPSIPTLIERGYLATPSYMIPTLQDLSRVGVSQGEYINREAETLVNQPKIVGHIVGHYAKYASDRKAIVFANSVDHARHLARQFKVAGFASAQLDAKTPDQDRQVVEKLFREGECKVLVNCMVYTEGVDVPDCDCVILARPTKSLVQYLQMTGRGLRPSDKGCLIIDHAGCVIEHGPVEQEWEWFLEKGGTQPQARIKDRLEKAERDLVCDNCGTVFAASPICPHCGERIAKVGRDVAYLRTHLKRATREEIQALRKPVDPRRKIWTSSVGFAARKNYSLAWAMQRYKRETGVWPHKGSLGDLMPTTAQFHEPASTFYYDVIKKGA